MRPPPLAGSRREHKRTKTRAAKEGAANCRLDPRARKTSCDARLSKRKTSPVTRRFTRVSRCVGAAIARLRMATFTACNLSAWMARKDFCSGGRVAGCFFTLADKADGPLVICEGYATGASIHEATGHSVICCMNSGNLLGSGEGGARTVAAAGNYRCLRQRSIHRRQPWQNERNCHRESHSSQVGHSDVHKHGDEADRFQRPAPTATSSGGKGAN